ncbi:MAG: ABC transporter permease [Bacteroidales bacterium]|nr:ABC transporter permease [Bacteroidales bacterium]
MNIDIFSILFRFSPELDKKIDTFSFTFSYLITLLVILVVFIFLLSVLVSRKRFRKTLYNNKVLLFSFIIIFLAGFVIYFKGFYYDAMAKNPATVFLRSFTASLEMFLGKSSIIGINPHLKEVNGVYMFWFILVHTLALLLISLVVLKLIGFRLVNNLRVLWYTIIKKRIEYVYVFFGLNDTTTLLAQDLYKKSQKKSMFIFIESEKGLLDENEEKISVTKIFSGTSNKRTKTDYISDWNALILRQHGEFKMDSSKDGIFGKLGLKNLDRIIKRNRLKQFKLFLLSYEKEEDNISKTWEIVNAVYTYNTDNKKYNQKNEFPKIDVYCHAQKENQDTVFEYDSKVLEYPERLEIHVIDSAYLTVQELKKDIKSQPVSFVKINKEKGTVESEFNALVIGFNRTGKEAFNFLYEFSAFCSNNEGDKSPVNIYVVDTKMNEILPELYQKMPGLDPKRPKLEGEEENNTHLEFLNCSAFSQEFWDLMNRKQDGKTKEEDDETKEKDGKTLLEKLNYVVVAMGDDKLSLDFLPTFLNNMFSKRKGNLSYFRLFVRNYKKETYNELNALANHYNNIYSKKYETIKDNVHIFGTDEKIFTEDSIVSDKILTRAKIFYQQYEKSKESPEEMWQKRRKKEKTKYNSTIEVERRLLSVESQDIANVMHIATKMKLMSISSDDLERLEEYQMASLDRKDSEIKDKDDKEVIDYLVTYPNATKEQSLLLNNIAKCEHLRWNALSTLLGYTYSGTNDKSYVNKTHDCLVSNRTLHSILEKKETYKYDCNTIDLSLRLYKDNLDLSE